MFATASHAGRRVSPLAIDWWSPAALCAAPALRVAIKRLFLPPHPLATFLNFLAIVSSPNQFSFSESPNLRRCIPLSLSDPAPDADRKTSAKCRDNYKLTLKGDTSRGTRFSQCPPKKDPLVTEDRIRHCCFTAHSSLLPTDLHALHLAAPFQTVMPSATLVAPLQTVTPPATFGCASPGSDSPGYIWLRLFRQ